MKHLQNLAQPGVLSDPTQFAEYLTFVLSDGATAADAAEAMGEFAGVGKSIGQKDPGAELGITIGFSASAWQQMFPDRMAPAQLRAFRPMKDGKREFPSTPGDIFLMIKSGRMDLNFQAAKYAAAAFGRIGRLTEDIQGFQYLDNRDMIDFVDGTENPKGGERTASVLVGDEDPDHAGGSYLTVQRYVDREELWDSQSAEYQERVIGRTKWDDIELSDEAKPPWAHNAKSKVIVDGEEVKMFRQNRPFGNAIEHGTMFIGFARSPDVLETSLTQMITADSEGDYDRLLDFVDAKTGANYFVPPQSFIDSFDA
jgi:putative iron-dependent peroxidase